ncbi:hypothetical protein MTsPCn3_25810 [Erythrobacter sp. MTPC3]
MSTTWARAIELVRDNFGLLAVIAGIFLLLPTVTLYLLVPDLQALMEPGADPDMVTARMAEMAGPLITYGLISMVFSFAGYGAMVALMGDDRPTVGQAIKTGLKIVPSAFGILILFILCYFIAAMIVAIPIGVIASLSGMASLAIIAAVLILAVVIYLLARMSMSLPVLVFENTLNPIKAVLGSFKMTGPKQWSILLFWGILLAAYMVIALLITSIFSLIAAIAGDSTAAMLILGLTNGALGMIVGMIVSGLAVAMYGQLAGPSDTELTSTFD